MTSKKAADAPVCPAKVVTSKGGRLYEKCQPNAAHPTNDFIEKQSLSLTPLVPAAVLDECHVAIEKAQLEELSCFPSHQGTAKKSYFQGMRAWIDSINELDRISADGPLPDDENEAGLCVRVATYVSFGINFCLLLAKSAALHSSQSYTIISSLCDSCLDLIAGVILSLTAANSKFTKEDLRQFPIGKSRISVVGILVFSILMACCALYIIMQCTMSLHAHELAPHTTHIAMHVMTHTITTKFLMAIVYKCLRHPLTDTLAEDHRNDVLTNTFGMFMYWGGDHMAWWMDSVGGIILSLFVLVSWCGTSRENAKKLIGEASPPELVRSITYVSANHHPLIIGVEQVIAFQMGPQYFCEVHIVVPGNTPTEVSHEIGESLQLKLERIPDIERAWVHVDWEKHNDDEHVLNMRASGKFPKPQDITPEL